MAPFTHVEMGELAAELTYTPAALRKAHLDRLGRLIAELQPDRLYAYEYIFHRITLFATEAHALVVFTGRDLQRDLGLLLRRLSPAAPPDALDPDDPAQTLAQAAAQCRMTLTTLNRWGREGLPVCCYLYPDGRRAWGVRRQALAAFLAARQSAGAGLTPRLSRAERDRLIARAEELSRSGAAATDVVRALAAEFDRSAATVRRVLRAQQKPVVAADGLEAAWKAELTDLYRSGASVSDLARRFRRSSAAIYRVLHDALLERVTTHKTNYIPSPEFADPDAENICLGPEGLFTYPPEPAPDAPEPPPGLAPFLRDLYTVPLLTREREGELFRKYNYIKYRMAMLQEQIARAGYRAGMLERFEELQEAAAQVRRILIRCNLRLVVSIAKRHIGPITALPELMSEGNVCLIRAVECYDYRREARFATYATWAVTKHFARVVPEENYHLATFVTGQQARLDRTGDASENAVERVEALEHLRGVLAGAAAKLSERERTVIAAHFGTDGRPARTLEEIGRVFGLTRERIRQIESRALGKLRDLISPDMLQGLT